MQRDKQWPAGIIMYWIFKLGRFHYSPGWAHAPLGSDWVQFVHLRLLSGPNLNQKFDVIIAANASSVCHTSRLKLQCCFFFIMEKYGLEEETVTAMKKDYYDWEQESAVTGRNILSNWLWSHLWCPNKHCGYEIGGSDDLGGWEWLEAREWKDSRGRD